MWTSGKIDGFDFQVKHFDEGSEVTFRSRYRPPAFPVL